MKAAIEPGYGIQCDLDDGHAGDHYDDMYELFWMGALERNGDELACAGCGAGLGHNWHVYDDKNLCDPCFVSRAYQSLEARDA